MQRRKLTIKSNEPGGIRVDALRVKEVGEALKGCRGMGLLVHQALDEEGIRAIGSGRIERAASAQENELIDPVVGLGSEFVTGGQLRKERGKG